MRIRAFPAERVTGIEPALSAWEAEVLPLNYTRVLALGARWSSIPHQGVKAKTVSRGRSVSGGQVRASLRIWVWCPMHAPYPSGAGLKQEQIV